MSAPGFDATKKQRYFAGMKTVNLTIDEETWRAARRLAVERDTSVSALVREALEHVTKSSDRREAARREMLAMIGKFGGRGEDAVPGGAQCPALTCC